MLSRPPTRSQSPVLLVNQAQSSSRLQCRLAEARSLGVQVTLLPFLLDQVNMSPFSDLIAVIPFWFRLRLPSQGRMVNQALSLLRRLIRPRLHLEVGLLPFLLEVTAL